MSDIVEKILATPPENLTYSDLITIRFNGFVAHNYWLRWNWSDRKNLRVVKLEHVKKIGIDTIMNYVGTS